MPRFGGENTKTTIIELLSADWYFGLLNSADVASTDWAYMSTNTTRTTGEATSAATAAIDVEDPLTFGFVAAFTTGVTQQNLPHHYDFTDNNGNGVLVATDRIFIVGANVSGTLANKYTCKLKYRLVNVGIAEYVGIVQSQQA